MCGIGLKRQTSQWNIIKSPDIDTHSYDQLDFTQNNPIAKRYSFQQIVLKPLNIPMERKQPQLFPYTSLKNFERDHRPKHESQTIKSYRKKQKNKKTGKKLGIADFLNTKKH